MVSNAPSWFLLTIIVHILDGTILVKTICVFLLHNTVLAAFLIYTARIYTLVFPDLTFLRNFAGEIPYFFAKTL